MSFCVAVIFYGISAMYSVFLFRKGFRQDNWINYGLLAIGASWHTLAMFQRGFSFQRCPINNLYEATLFVGWTMVVSFLLMGLWPRVRVLGAIAAPLLLMIGVFALMPMVDPPRGDAPNFSNAWVSLHAALSLLAYGTFGAGCIAAIVYLFQERDLKFNKRRALAAFLPPIQRLETIVGRLLLVGFILLSAGLLVGAFDLKRRTGDYFKEDAKVIWSILVWCLYLLLIVSRWQFAQRGRRFAVGAIASFVFVLLTFWSFNLLSGIHHPGG